MLGGTLRKTNNQSRKKKTPAKNCRRLVLFFRIVTLYNIKMSPTIQITAVIIIGFLVLAYLIKKWLEDLAEKQKPSDELTEWLKSTHSRLDEQSKTFTSTLHTNTKALNERLDKAAQVIGHVQKNIGEMAEIGRGMKELQEFLRSPKLRGNVGEHILKELLGQMLPKQQFHLQYTFSSGATVDAAIQTASGIIPVDSKFPMENFRKITQAEDEATSNRVRREFSNDVRKHIRDISKKYILTDEGTIDYALMYIPSEAVYYEIVNEHELFDYAGKFRVLPVSPTTFYAYLRAILMSFEGQKIEQRAKEILVALRAIEKDYENVGNDLSTLQRHLNNASNMLTNVLGGFSRLGQRIGQTRLLGDSEQEELTA